MIRLDVADLVLVAAGVLGVEPDAVLATVDIPALQRAPTEPAPHPVDPPAQAAALLHGLLRHHPLPRGNRRFALKEARMSHRLVRQSDSEMDIVLKCLGASPDEIRTQVRQLHTAEPSAAECSAALRRAMDTAIDAGDFVLAAALRTQDRDLRAPATTEENARLRGENTRLRTLLHEADIDPDPPSPRPA